MLKSSHAFLPTDSRCSNTYLWSCPFLSARSLCLDHALGPGSDIPSTIVSITLKDQLARALLAGQEGPERYAVSNTVQDLKKHVRDQRLRKRQLLMEMEELSNRPYSLERGCLWALSRLSCQLTAQARLYTWESSSPREGVLRQPHLRKLESQRRPTAYILPHKERPKQVQGGFSSPGTHGSRQQRSLGQYYMNTQGTLYQAKAPAHLGTSPSSKPGQT